MQRYASSPRFVCMQFSIENGKTWNCNQIKNTFEEYKSKYVSVSVFLKGLIRRGIINGVIEWLKNRRPNLHFHTKPFLSFRLTFPFINSFLKTTLNIITYTKKGSGLNMFNYFPSMPHIPCLQNFHTLFRSYLKIQ